MRSLRTAVAALPALVVVPMLAPLPAPPTGLASPHAAQAEAGPGYLPPVPLRVARAFDPPTRDWQAGHRGVDLWAAQSAVVVAPQDGVITFAGSVAGKPVVVVTHGDGLRSSLEPVAATAPRGTVVAAGRPVGVLASPPGSDANPDHCAALTAEPGTAGCVHWGVRRGEVYLDPLALVGAAPPIVLLPVR